MTKLSAFQPVKKMQNNPILLRDWLQSASRRLLHRAPETRTPQEAAIESQVLVGHVISRPRAWILAHPEYPLPAEQVEYLEALLARLAEGTPLPYLTGHQEFFGLDFEVSPAVLIPRPETELMVETALDWLKANPNRHHAADVGTGSGCIAISLAKHAPHLRLTAVDRSWQALQITRRNLQKHHCQNNIHLLNGDLLTALNGPLDLVCANLPYIPHATLESLEVARHEPVQALDGGPDGLRFVEALLEDAPRWLAPGGLLLLEIESSQGESAARLAQCHLPQARVQVRQDLAGLDRLVIVQN